MSDIQDVIEGESDGTIVHGDCLDVMPDIESGSVDMILCDLPYGTTACSWDDIIPLESLWDQYKRVIKDNGAIVLTASQPFTSKMVMSNLDMFRYEWIWDKHIPRGMSQAKHQPMRKHESVLVFSKEYPFRYYPIKTKRDKPVTVKNYQKNENSFHGNYKDNNNKIYTYRYKNPTTIIENCWEANKGKLHPTQKPVALFEYLIRTYTNKDSLILDNAAGSGTTGVAARKLKRRYILIEKEKEYYEIAKERVQKVSREVEKKEVKNKNLEKVFS